jgi:hypothetical protein
VDAEVRAPDGDERLSQIAHGDLVAIRLVGFSDRDAGALSAVELADTVEALLVATDAPCGLSVVATSASSELYDGSHPGNSMPASLRMRLRPPSQPTRYFARSVVLSEIETSTPVSSCANPVTSCPR